MNPIEHNTPSDTVQKVDTFLHNAERDIYMSLSHITLMEEVVSQIFYNIQNGVRRPLRPLGSMQEHPLRVFGARILCVEPLHV